MNEKTIKVELNGQELSELRIALLDRIDYCQRKGYVASIEYAEKLFTKLKEVEKGVFK